MNSEMKQITRGELEQRVLGLTTDIFIAERAYSMLQEIGDQRKQIEKLSGFKELLLTMQAACKDQFLIATARLFDKALNGYETTCVYGLLSYLKKNAAYLPKVIEWSNLIQTMTDYQFDPEIIKIAEEEQSGERLVHAIVGHFEDLLKSESIKPHLTSLKRLRDKKLAHNELIRDTDIQLRDTLPITTFKDLKSLIEIAKSLVGVVGWAWMNTVFVHDGDYTFTSGATRPANSVGRLIEKLAT